MESASALLFVLIATYSTVAFLAWGIQGIRGGFWLFSEEPTIGRCLWGPAAAAFLLAGYLVVQSAVASLSLPNLPVRMGVSGLANLAYVGVILGLLRVGCGARSIDLGLTIWRMRIDALRGFVAAGVSLPWIYAVYYYALRTWPPEAHPAATGIADEADWRLRLLVVFSAVIAAPIAEEVLFRGVLLKGLWRMVTRGNEVDTGSRRSPLLEQAGIVVVSTLFAGLHAPQWPAPIPLFLFSIILGELFRRTGRLTAPIVAHAMFNALGAAAVWISR